LEDRRKVRGGEMTKKQKTFVLKRLVPFILREQGRGFGMDYWMRTGITPGDEWIVDGVARRAPRCGTVCCIGGSINFLKTKGKEEFGPATAAEHIGLSYDRACSLFYGWTGEYADVRSWPEPYLSDYEEANTPYRKARVAVRLLREIVRTDGKVMGD